MYIGLCSFTIRLPENHSLKGKRRIIRSFSARIINKFNVSCAEVSATDKWQIGEIAIVTVSNSAKHTDRMLQKIIHYVENQKNDFEIVEMESDVIQY